MAADVATTSKGEFLASLESLSQQYVTQRTVLAAIAGTAFEDFSLTEWKKLVDFAAEQAGRWTVRWLFSPIEAPDREAETEADGWNGSWRRWSDLLIERVPEAAEHIKRTKELHSVGCAIQRRIEFNKNSIVKRASSSVMSSLGILLNRVGLDGIGRWLYRSALYPPGTMGRVEG